MKLYSINYKEQVINYEVSHRPTITRRIHLEVSDEGELRVVAPRRMSRRAIQKTLQLRAQHVVRYLLRARAQQQDLADYRYVSGEMHLFMGQRYPLEILEQQGKRGKAELADGKIRIIVLESNRDRVKSRLENWYRRQAQLHFAQQLTFYSKAVPWTGGQAPPMRLRKMKRTWGSCSSKGVITLNPHLVKAPHQCIDYVIVHEICHLREHNHSKAFYRLQEQVYPGWREAKTLLTNRGHVFLHL